MTRLRALCCLAAILGTCGIAVAQPRGSQRANSRPPSRVERPREEKVLDTARNFLIRHRYRDAEQLLQSNLSRVNNDYRRRYIAALGNVYYESGKFALARQRFNEALDQSLQIKETTRDTLNEQATIALGLAKTLAEIGEKQRAVHTLRRIYDRYEKHRIDDPVSQIRLLTQWAQCGELSDIQSECKVVADRAERAYQQHRLPAQNYVLFLENLAQYHSLALNYREGIATLERALKMAAPRQKPDLHTQMAELYRAEHEASKEIQTLILAKGEAHQFAAKTQDRSDEARAAQLYEQAELERLLAEALMRQERHVEAAKEFGESRQNYQLAANFLKRTRDRDSYGLLISEIVLLERTAEVAGQMLELRVSALPLTMDEVIADHTQLLTAYQQALLPGDPRIGYLSVTLGSLYIRAAQFDEALLELKNAREYWEQREPPDARMLALSLNLSADASLSRGLASQAAGFLKRADEVCQKSLAETELRWSVELNLGRLARASGDYREALGQFRAVLAAIQEHGFSDDLHSAALLHLGLLHKELLHPVEAKILCEQALALRVKHVGQGHPTLLPHYLALGGLEIATRDADALERVTQVAKTILDQQAGDDPNRLELLHQQAMVHYLHDQAHPSGDERSAARAIWEQLRAHGERLDERAVPRALHYLSRLDYLDWSDLARQANEQFADLAEQSAPEFQERMSQHQARRRQFEAESKICLEQQAEYEREADQYRKDTESEFAAREQTFTQLSTRRQELETSSNQLEVQRVALNSEKEMLYEEFGKLQSRMSNSSETGKATWVQLLAHAEGLAKEAIDRLGKLNMFPSLRHTALCNYAQILHAQSKWQDNPQAGLNRALDALEQAVELIETSRTNTVGNEIERAEFFAQYEAAFDLLVQLHVEAGQYWEAILAAERGRSRTLLDQLLVAGIDNAGHSLDQSLQLIAGWKSSAEPALYYYIGSSHSYLFVLGKDQAIEAHRLRVTSSVNVVSDVSAYDVAVLVSQLRTGWSNPNAAQDLQLRADSLAAAKILLPEQVQEFLRHVKKQGHNHLMVIPHGAITQLPLEALIISESAEAPYVVDVAPPFVYAPSLVVLEQLRQSTTNSEPIWSALTLGNPLYQAVTQPASPVAVTALTSDDLGSRFDQLGSLDRSEQECQRIRDDFAQEFGEGKATLLTQDRASELEFRRAMKLHPTLVHIAAHGIVGERAGEMLAWIALARPQVANPDSEQDGVLELRELYELDFSGCELAILSACETNLSLPSKEDDKSTSIGLGRSDSSFSLASAFLRRGARRVLATQWEVADDSTSELIALFVKRLVRQAGAGNALDYAKLLADARTELRQQHPEWDAPFYWAPFVLVGPATGN